tara:strand:+ start:1738 stop:4359 length:2622 start_codon:yes stop_codon:yes gene_type:complete
MAYNSSKGPQTHGDVKYEGDAEDTQIDFENDFVAIKTNGVQRLIVSSNTVTSSVALSCSHGITGSTLDVGNFTTIIDATHISSSLPISASSVWVNGSQLTSGGAVANYNTAADNRVITSVDSDTIQGEQNLTFDGSRLTVAGDINMSGMTGSAISGTLSVFDLKDGKVQIGNEEPGTGVMVKIRGTSDSDVPLLVKSPSHEAILGVTGSGKVLVGGVYTAAKLNITGSNEEKFLAIKSTDVNPVLEVDNNHLSSSVHISASAFFGSGQHLTNLPSAAITTYNTSGDNRIVTSVNSTTVQGESALTFDGETLTVTGDLTASVGMVSAHIASSGHISSSLGITGSALHAGNFTTVIDTTHVSSSLNISGAAFYGSGQHLTNLPSAAITTYNTSGDNRIITSVNSTTVQGESLLTFDGATLYVSGNMKMQNNQPRLEFSNSAGTGLGLVGYNNSDNILIQNDTTNKHIVFKANDNGQIREGLRVDGAVPEVVVNQGSDSLVDFRVESDNNTHMIFVDGANDKVGINTDTPSHPLSVIGHVSASLGITGSAIHSSNGQLTLGMTDSGNPQLKASTNHFYIRHSTNNKHVRVHLGDDAAGTKFQIRNNSDVSVARIDSMGTYSGSLGLTGSSLLVANGTIEANKTHFSSSLAVSASSFWANGVQLTAGGGGSPGGSDTQIQYNNGGSFGGEANFVYDDGNDRVGIGNSAPTHTLSVTGGVAFTGDLTVTGTIRATKIIDVTRHYFSYGGTGATFIPHGEGTSDDATTAVTKTQFVAAFSGRLKRVIVRPKNAQNGHITASLHVAGDGVEDFAAGGSIVQHITQSMGGAATHGNINFSGSTTQFTAGQIVGVAIDFKNNPGDTNVTCIWEYNTTEDVLS